MASQSHRLKTRNTGTRAASHGRPTGHRPDVLARQVDTLVVAALDGLVDLLGGVGQVDSAVAPLILDAGPERGQEQQDRDEQRTTAAHAVSSNGSAWGMEPTPRELTPGGRSSCRRTSPRSAPSPWRSRPC